MEDEEAEEITGCYRCHYKSTIDNRRTKYHLQKLLVQSCGRSYCCNCRLQSMLLHAMVGLSIATVAVFYRNRQVAKLITDECCLLHKDVIPSRWSKNQRSPSSPPQCRLLRILKNPELSYATSSVDHQRLFLALLSLCLRGGACAFFPASKKPPK